MRLVITVERKGDDVEVDIIPEGYQPKESSESLSLHLHFLEIARHAAGIGIDAFQGRIHPEHGPKTEDMN